MMKKLFLYVIKRREKKKKEGRGSKKKMKFGADHMMVASFE
jgi:hypothetical protein